ncbi:hypothetical protein PAXINDRAFT_15559 [Paxillus involutus ATCC 200175]|uniref:Uncharacterized protein n=1 Tax=Paxillus involutus ATCC 200175 TaxID=664439 RepID=A0A0C9TLN8_PAXIN|nr:hypothetical protein PAXINDRAFT_15559 [Paxillus involutus ATCC 200175]
MNESLNHERGQHELEGLTATSLPAIFVLWDCFLTLFISLTNHDHPRRAKAFAPLQDLHENIFNANISDLLPLRPGHFIAVLRQQNQKEVPEILLGEVIALYTNSGARGAKHEAISSVNSAGMPSYTMSINLISDTDHADDEGLVKKAAPKAKHLRRTNDAHTSTFEDDNPMIGHGVPVPSSAPNQTTGLGRGAVPLTASKQSTTAGHGMPSNAPPQSTGRTSSVTSINPNRGTSSIMNRAASVTTIPEDDSAANGVADTRSLGGGASDFNDEGDGDDGKNDEPTQEAVDEDGFLVDIQVQSIGEPAGQ